MAKIDSYSLDTSITDNDSVLGIDSASGATKRFTMSSMKTYIASEADITAVTAGTGLSGGGTSGDVTLTIDSTVVTLTGTQTLTNKTLTSPIISSISNSGTITLPTSSDTLVGRATTDTLTNKTLTSPSIATPTWTATESAIASGDYLLFLDATASSETKKEGLDDIASLFAGAGLAASSSVLAVGAGTGITVNANDVTITPAQTAITSVYNSSLAVGYGSSHANIDFSTDNSIIFDIDGTSQIQLDDGVLKPTTDSDVDLGTSSLYFKDSYIDTVTTTGNVTVGGALSVSDNNITNVGDIALDSISADGTDINVAISDNSATSFTVKQGSDAYLIVDTANSSESVSIGTGISGTAITIGHGTSETTIGDNLTVTGNLTVSGDTVTVNTATLSVEDPLIILGSGNNSSDAVDLGLYGLYDTSGSQDLYSGLFRDASDSGKWKLFKSLQTAPTTTVNTGGTGYAVDTLVANLEGTVTGTATGLSSTLAVSSGGTNATSFADKSVIITQDSGTDTLAAAAMTTNGSLLIGGSSGPAVGTLTAGSNVSITNADGAITLNVSAAGDAFKTISVSGQSDVVADGTADTLTLVAGTGTTITTNASGDTITINAGANTVEVDEYTGNGSTASYTLSTACTNENNLLVYMDGVFQHHNTYSVSSATLTFDTNVPNGSKVEAYHMISVNNSDMVQAAVAGTLMDVSGATGSVTFNVDLTEASEAAIANGDYILFLDGGATGTHAKEAIADVATLFAGAGLTASSSVMAVGAGTGITVNANDVAITAAQTGITSVVNSSLEIGRDADNRIKFGTDNQIIFEVDGGDNVIFKTSGEIEASSLDISGDADIDGTLEADAITVDGTALATYIRDTVGTNMLSSNTESGITVTYDTSNDNIDFAIDAAQTGITSLLATDIKIGEDDQTKIDFETADTINFYAGNEKQLILTDGALTPGTNAIVDLGTDALEFKDGYFDGTLEADAITIGGTNVVTGSLITTLGTISAGVWNGTAIASGYIANDAIDSQHYTDGSIDTAHIADDAVTAAKIADGSIDTARLADDAISQAKVGDDAIGADQLASNAVVTASIVDNSITHDKLEGRYTALKAWGSGTDRDLDFDQYTTFTATMTGNSTYTITAPKQGQVVDLILSGNYTPTLALSGATFNKVGTTDYDGGETNLIQILCADDSGSEIFYYSVATITSDTTP